MDEKEPTLRDLPKRARQNLYEVARDCAGIISGLMNRSDIDEQLDAAEPLPAELDDQQPQE